MHCNYTFFGLLTTARLTVVHCNYTFFGLLTTACLRRTQIKNHHATHWEPGILYIYILKCFATTKDFNQRERTDTKYLNSNQRERTELLEVTSEVGVGVGVLCIFPFRFPFPLAALLCGVKFVPGLAVGIHAMCRLGKYAHAGTKKKKKKERKEN